MEFSQDPNLEEYVSRFLEDGRNQKLSIFVVGRTGAGKSQIINSLIGWPVAEEGHTLKAQSMQVKCYKMIKNGVEVSISDSPGLGDRTNNSDEEYLDQIKREVGKAGLVLFCASMNVKRVDQADLDCMTKLTQAFGSDLWKHAMLVLTYANEVCVPPSPPGSPSIPLQEIFCARKRMFKETYHQILSEVGVNVDELQRLPVVTAGHVHELALPDTCDWRQNLWMEAFKRMQQLSKPAFLFANAKRLFSASGVTEHSRMKREGYSAQNETCNTEKSSSVLQNSEARSPLSASPTHRQSNISGTMAANIEFFQNLESIERSGDRITRSYTESHVQSLRASFERKISSTALEPQMRSASLHRPKEKQSAASSKQKGTSCTSEQDIRITVSAENEKGIWKVMLGYVHDILDAAKYGKAGADVGKLIGEVFSDSLGADSGKKAGIAVGQLIFFIQKYFFTQERKYKQITHEETGPE